MGLNCAKCTRSGNESAERNFDFFFEVSDEHYSSSPICICDEEQANEIKLHERNSSCCWLTFIFECSRKCNNKVSPVLGAIKFYVRNMGHYFSLWFTRGHKVKHLDGSNSWMTILVDNVDRLLARENFEDGAKVCSIFMTLLNFQPVFWSFICCQYSVHFLFSRMSRLVSYHHTPLLYQLRCHLCLEHWWGLFFIDFFVPEI